MAVDAAGNVLIADTANDRVRVVASATGTFYGQAMTAGDIYTLASAPGTSSLAVDAAGNVVITVPDRDRVRVIAGSSGTFYRRHMSAGALYDLAGNGTLGPTGAGGPAVDAQLQGVAGISSDTDGNFVTDAGGIGGGDLVQLVAGSSGSFYGQLMTAGDIYTIAGGGTSRLLGRRRPRGPWRRSTSHSALALRQHRKRDHRRCRQLPGAGRGRGHRHVLRVRP